MNVELIILFIGYFISIFAGFFMHYKNKKKINKKYEFIKPILLILIVVVSISTLTMALIMSSYIKFMLYIGIIQIIFLIYFFSFVTKKSRCWKQHHMLFYNFILLVIIYFGAIIANYKGIYFFAILIYIYNILEFQFAKFDFHQKKLWD